MTYIDNGLLNATERLCRRFQVLTGRTNVWLAAQLTNLSIIVYFVGAAVYLLSSRYTLPVGIGLGVFCATLMYVLSQTVLRVPIETHETSAYRRVAKGLRNPRRLRDEPLRIAFLTLSVVMLYPVVFVSLYLQRSVVFLLSYALILLTTVVLYVLACDPLPPCPGTLPAWLRGLVGSRVEPQEVPD